MLLQKSLKCTACQQCKPRSDFSAPELKNGARSRKCRVCEVAPVAPQDARLHQRRALAEQLRLFRTTFPEDAAALPSEVPPPSSDGRAALARAVPPLISRCFASASSIWRSTGREEGWGAGGRVV